MNKITLFVIIFLKQFETHETKYFKKLVRIHMITGTAAATFPTSSSVCIIFFILAWNNSSNFKVSNTYAIISVASLQPSHHCLLLWLPRRCVRHTFNDWKHIGSGQYVSLHHYFSWLSLIFGTNGTRLSQPLVGLY